MKPNDSFEIYSDGRYYDLENEGLVKDISFYRKQAKRIGGPVLELACGTGRITIPLAEAGLKMTGLDISPPMLQQARVKAEKKGLNIEFIETDCRNFDLEERFSTILFPFNAIAHIHDHESYEALFSCVKNHLQDGGRFIVDWFNPRLDILIRDPDKRYPCYEYDDPDGRGKIVITEHYCPVKIGIVDV
ncbi:MAG: hypothetical protein DRP47_06865 [Candidatus Zixiibacteriota bacterium]|nr:MAG: hypothetical protein DRP47_06865 [candidate division Zixibacteria bacterium]